MRFLPAPQVIFNLLFDIKPTPKHRENQAPERAPSPTAPQPWTVARSACFGDPQRAPPTARNFRTVQRQRPAHIRTRSRTPARAYYLYILYIYIIFPHVCARPRAYMRTPPHTPAPLRTRFYLFPFLYDLLSSISPLFKIYFPFFSSLYDLFPFMYDLSFLIYTQTIYIYVLYSTDELHMSNCSYVRRLTI